MKFAEINRKFTETVAQWIAKGYTINTATMAGHQGEIGKVDLTDGKEIIRIMLDSKHDFETGDFFCAYEVVILTVGRCTDKVLPNSESNLYTIWNQNLEIISEQKFYVIGETRNGKWYGTYEEMKSQNKKNYERRMARATTPYQYFQSQKAVEIVLPFVKRMPRAKSTKAYEIEGVRKTVKPDGRVLYEVKSRGNIYRIR